MNITHRLAGRLKCLVSKEGQAPHRETDWFDNLITNQGLDQIGSSAGYGQPFATPNICGFIGVGTGSTTPSITDTTLTTFLASYPTYATPTSTVSVSNSYVAGAPAYYKSVLTYNFAVGNAAGNLTELGAGFYTSGDTTFKVFSHALFVDGGGSPTTFTVLADEILTVIYELRCYLDQSDNTYSMLINGISYGGTYRLANIATAPVIRHSQVQDSGNIYLRVYSGTIQVVTSSPSGTSTLGNGTSAGYTNGNYYVDYTSSFDVASGNYAGGITAILIASYHGRYQFEVSPFIPKDNTKTLSLTYRLSWARSP